jgi:hypothetical protein
MLLTRTCRDSSFRTHPNTALFESCFCGRSSATSSVPRQERPHPGATPRVANAPEERGAPARSADYSRRTSGRKTPLALRHISLSRRTPGRQLPARSLSTEMSTARTPGRTVSTDDRSIDCSTWYSEIGLSLLASITRAKKDRTRLASSRCVRTAMRPTETTGGDHRRIETVMVGSAISGVSSRRTPGVHTYTQASHESSTSSISFFSRHSTRP